jgi:hypothetical protein
MLSVHIRPCQGNKEEPGPIGARGRASETGTFHELAPRLEENDLR